MLDIKPKVEPGFHSTIHPMSAMSAMSMGSMGLHHHHSLHSHHSAPHLHHSSQQQLNSVSASISI